MTNATQEQETKVMANGAAAKAPKEEKADDKAKANTALAKKQQAELLPPGVTEPALNKAVKEVHDLKSRGSALAWDLGTKLREIHDGQLWKARKGEEGGAAYKHWNAFCHAELGITPTHAYTMMDVSKAFTRPHVEKWGVSKLGLIIRAPEEDQPKLLLEAAKHSKHELAEKVSKLRKEKGKGKRVTGRKAMPDGKPGASHGKAVTKGKDAITVATLLEKNTTVQLFCRPEKRGEEPTKRAKHLKDVPVGWFDLANGVRQYITIGAAPTTGELVAKIMFKRVEE